MDREKDITKLHYRDNSAQAWIEAEMTRIEEMYGDHYCDFEAAAENADICADRENATAAEFIKMYEASIAG